MIVFLTVPASIGLIVLGEPLIRLFFEHGEFSPEATRATAFALRFYALGLLGHAAVEIVDRVFYAFHDTWTPVRVALGAILANLALSLVLMRTPLNYGGLALANAVAAAAEGLTLLWLLSNRLRRLDGSGLGLRAIAGRLARTIAAALGMAAVVLFASELLERELGLAPSVRQPVVLAISIAVGAAAYLGLAFALRLDETRTILSLIRRR
jgi:putative peptidoglycan lipid II flippase